VPHNTVHFYVWQALDAVDHSQDPLLDNIKSPTHARAIELEVLELGFASLSNYKLRGTIAAGDVIVFWMQMPTNEDVDGDVTAYYTPKGYYTYGLQVRCIYCSLIPVSSPFLLIFFSIRLFAMQIVDLL